MMVQQSRHALHLHHFLKWPKTVLWCRTRPLDGTPTGRYARHELVQNRVNDPMKRGLRRETPFRNGQMWDCFVFCRILVEYLVHGVVGLVVQNASFHTPGLFSKSQDEFLDKILTLWRIWRLEDSEI